MSRKKQRLFQVIGWAGVAACVVTFALRPSFPTPDKLLVFLFFVFLIFHKATELLKRLGPFVALILVYESFRAVADHLNSHINYSLPPHADRLIFGNLPTTYLQNWLWHGHVRWYDFIFYAPYLLFFVIPIGLAILVWQTRERYYWRVVATYLLLFFSGFVTFLLFPAAPPWLAAQNHLIQPIVRISSDVWAALGIQDFPSFYNAITPNPVAAVPSLHAGVATLLPIFVFKLYGRRWGTLSLLYPLLIFVGVVYQGEHYAFDVICGIVYAALAYYLTPKLMNFFKRLRSPSQPIRSKQTTDA